MNLQSPPNLNRLQQLRLYLITKVNRNTVLFITGFVGIIHETLFQHAERPTLLILFAAMMGLPAFLSPTTAGHTSFATKRIEETTEEQSEQKLVIK